MTTIADDPPFSLPSDRGGAAAPGSRLFRTIIIPGTAILVLAAGGACWLVPPMRHWSHGVWLAGLIVTGAPLVWQTLRGLLRGHFAADVVAALAIVAAVAFGQPIAGLVIVLMQSGGEALERYAEGRASAAVRALEAAAPRLAHRVGRDGSVSDEPADAVDVGDILLVRPGELVPCDAEVVSGRSHVDTSRLTGEPMPVSAVAGTRLMSGSANGDGALTVRVRALAAESQYARIVELVRSAQATRAPLQRVADRYAIWLTPVTLVICVIAWLVSGDATRVLAVLVVATPCPLILATPVAIIGGINRAARRQIIVRNGAALEQLASVTVGVFDKTGTLTVGRPRVQTILTGPGFDEAAIYQLAGAVERDSSHLLARAFEDAAAAAGVLAASASGVTESPGRGVRGMVDGRTVTVGSRGFVVGQHPAATAELDRLDAGLEGLRAFVVVDGRAAAIIVFADLVRPGIERLFVELASSGVRRTVLLSGDHQANVQTVGRALGIDESRGDLLPADKLAAVDDLLASGERVLFVGDGTNDAPALTRATVGVALAAHGGGITAEAAGVVILTDDVSRVAEAVRIAQATMRVARQSIVAGLGLSGAAMVAAAFGLIPPTVGALLQEVIDVLVILNALRASRDPKRARAGDRAVSGPVPRVTAPRGGPESFDSASTTAP